MLRLLAEPPISPRASRTPRRTPRAGARRPHIVRLERTRTARPARGDGSGCAPGPSTDDPRARRRELAELGRLAMAYAMHEALAR